MDSNYSLADIAAATRDNDWGYGGGNMIFLIMLYLIAGGGWNGGWNRGGGDFGQYATAASQTEILLGQQFQNLDNKLDRLGNGIADATFALNNTVNGVGTHVLESKYDNALRIDSLGAKMQECCCATQQAIHAEGEATRAMIRESEMQRVRDENQTLRFQVSQQDQNGHILSALGRWVANPPCPQNYGCGCGIAA